MALLAAPCGGAAAAPPGSTPDAHPSRIVVKYGPRVDACADCLLERSGRFAALTGTDSLDRIHRRIGVRGARPLFFSGHGSGGGRSAAYAERRESVRARFPVRAARASAAPTRPDLSRVYVLDLPRGSDVAAAAALLASDPNVEYAEPDLVRTATWLPNDPLLATSGSWGQPYPDLWGLHTVQAPLAWERSDGGGIVVAVVDTGVKTRHPDLRANVWQNPGEVPGNRRDDDANGFVDDQIGWDFLRERGKPNDRHGHGTHVAGTIAAAGNDGLGVLGMAWGARIMPLRALDENGRGFASDLAAAILYAAENGADVINNSWGGFGISSAIADAIAAAADLGVVVVFAAGNDARTGYALGEANLREVIAVAATDRHDARASFSNYGDAVSVSAPGVDILSTRGGGRVGGSRLTSRYVRLSGTSMAAPHVAGLAAVLLSADPALATDEVRWHLELNADQPGYPGYEGQPWNPYLGWGRIDAARVFDAPTVTTRLRIAPRELHTFAALGTGPALALDVRFTTKAPVDWSFAASSWLSPDLASGSGDAIVPIRVDGSVLSPGTHSGSAGVTAMAAADGGGDVPLSVHVHRDLRAGGEILVAPNVGQLNDPPAIASNGSTTLVVWADAVFRLDAATIDATGTVSGPFPLVSSQCIQADCYRLSGNAIAVASDGTDFLVVFRHYIDVTNDSLTRDTRHEYVKALRVSATGAILDAQPLVLASQVQTFPHGNPNYDLAFTGPRAAFDGTDYVVLWRVSDYGGSVDRDTVRFRRVGVNGGLASAPADVYPTPGTAFWQIVHPRLACRGDGSCLVAWVEWDGEPAIPGEGFVRNTYAARIVGDQVLNDPPIVLLADTDFNNHFALGLAASDDGYAVTNLRRDCPSGAEVCRFDLFAARVSPTGVTLDPGGIQLNHPPSQGIPYARPLGLTFDGTSYVATFFDLAATPSTDYSLWPPPEGYTQGYPIFAARLNLDGTVVNDEPIGLLVHDGRTALSGEVVRTTAGSLVVWQDVRHDTPILKRSFYAQRISPPSGS